VTFTIGFFPSFFLYSAKISVKGQATQLKVKMAKKLGKFLGNEISNRTSQYLQESVKKVHVSFS